MPKRNPGRYCQLPLNLALCFMVLWLLTAALPVLAVSDAEEKADGEKIAASMVLGVPGRDSVRRRQNSLWKRTLRHFAFPVTTLNSFDADLSKLMTPLKGAEEGLKGLRSPLQDLGGELHGLSQPLGYLRMPIVDLKQPLEGIGESTAELVVPLEDLEQELAEVKEPLAELKAPIKELKEPIGELNAPISRLNKPITNLASPINELKGPITGLNKPIEDLSSDVDSLRNKVGQLSDTIKKLDETVNSITYFIVIAIVVAGIIASMAVVAGAFFIAFAISKLNINHHWHDN